MIVKTFKAYRDVAVKLDVVADRFFDYSQVVIIDEDKTQHVTLEPYQGLNIQPVVQGAGDLFTVQGTLPDYAAFEQVTIGLKPVGDMYLSASGVKSVGVLAEGCTDDGSAVNYNLFYQQGELVADVAQSKDGWRWVGVLEVPAHSLQSFWVVKYVETAPMTYQIPYVLGFTANNYLISSCKMPSQPYFAMPLRVITRVVTGSSVSSSIGQNIFWDNSEHNSGFGTASSQWRIWNGSTHLGGSVSPNTAYWVMMMQEVHGGTKLYYMVDDGTYTLDTLPEDDVSLWQLAVSISGTVFDPAGTKMRIGTGYTSTNEYWQGKIDLLSTRVDSGVSVVDEEMNVQVSWSAFWRPLVG